MYHYVLRMNRQNISLSTSLLKMTKTWLRVIFCFIGKTDLGILQLLFGIDKNNLVSLAQVNN